VRAHLCTTDARFHSAYGQRLESLVVLVDAFDAEIADLTDSIAHEFRDHAGYRAIQQVPRIGPIIAAIFVAEIGDVHRFTSAAHLASWCGLTPRHRESDTTVRRGPITKQGSKLIRWAAIEAAQRLGHEPGCTPSGNVSPSVATAGRSPRPPSPAS